MTAGERMPENENAKVGAEAPALAAVAPESEGKRINPYAVIANNSFTPRPQARTDLVERLLNDPRMHEHREGFLSCLQCGVCTSSCPAARFTNYIPRDIARRALEGDPSLLEDDTVWYCYYCYTCHSRCPRKNSVAVINQVIRSMQVESGYGRKHVEMFAAWGEQFYDKGMGGTPHVFFADIAEAWGQKWKDFIADRDKIRDLLGLGRMYPADKAVAEVRVIMEETGFKDRLLSLGAWGGQDNRK